MRAASPAASRFSGSVAALGEAMQQGGGQFGQQRRLGFQAAVGGSKSSARASPRGVGAAARAGSTKANSSSRSNAGIAAQAEPAERRRRMHQQRRRQATQVGGRLRRGQQQQFAIGGEDRGAAVSGDDGRRVGQGNARHGYRGGAVTADA